ncbi:B3 domain-containing protein Os01g0234100 [Linum grandiflorum]
MNNVMNKAEEMRANLPDDHPSFIKTMLRSHVTTGFWLGFSKNFCDDHLPMVDQSVELEDESGQVWEAKYLAGKQGLSGGWRKFSIDHKLAQGDVLVFQLLRPNKLKVYIVRRNDFEEPPDALANPNLDAPQPPAIEASNKSYENIKGKEFELAEHDEPDGNGIKGLGQERHDDLIRLQESAPDFRQVKTFEDFKIVTSDGTMINSELPEEIGFGYYQLCCSRNSFLHQSILKDLNDKLVAGMIAETVRIADAMMNSEVGTVTVEDFKTWGSKLKSFRKLGMEVGFLRSRLKELKCIFDKASKCKKLRVGKVNVEEKVANLEAQLGEAKGKLEEVDSEIERLGFDENGVELDFVELATAPWSSKH